MAVKMSDATHERFYDVEIAALASPSDRSEQQAESRLLNSVCEGTIVFLFRDFWCRSFLLRDVTSTGIDIEYCIR